MLAGPGRLDVPLNWTRPVAVLDSSDEWGPMSKRAVLEVIALDVEDAVAAQAGGADRLELVTDMAADGLTPAVATVAPGETAADARAAPAPVG